MIGCSIRSFIKSFFDSINDLINDHLSKTEKAVFELLRKNQKYSKNEIATIIGKSSITVQRVIKALTEKGFVERVGSNKNGYWVVK